MLPFLPPAVQHWIHVVLACAVAVFVVLKSDPTLGAIPWVVGVFTVLNTLNAIFTSAPGDAKELASLQTRVASLLTKMGPAAMLAFMLSLTACPQAVPIVGPTVSCVATVVADALKGDTLDQILTDAGPTCVSSVEQIISILVGESLKNPMIKDTAAYKDARVAAWIKVGQ